MNKYFWAVIVAAILVTPMIGTVGCDDDDDTTVVVTNNVPSNVQAPAANGTLQITVTGALVIDAFTQVNVKVDGVDIGVVAWPAGGTLNYPVVTGDHSVTADTDGPSSRHWTAQVATVPENGVAAVTLNAANSTM